MEQKIDKDGHSADYYWIEGTKRYKHGKKEEAENLFYKALAVDPNHACSLNNLACIREKEKRKKKAEKYYVKASQSDPNNFQISNNLLVFYSINGYIAEMGNQMTKELDDDLLKNKFTDNIDFKDMTPTGWVWTRSRYVGGSKVTRSFSSCGLIDPISYYTDKGDYWFYNKGRSIEAEKFYRLALEYLPDDFTLMFTLATLKERQGKTDEAAEIYGKIYQVAPQTKEKVMANFKEAKINFYANTNQCVKRFHKKMEALHPTENGVWIEATSDNILNNLVKYSTYFVMTSSLWWDRREFTNYVLNHIVHEPYSPSFMDVHPVLYHVFDPYYMNQFNFTGQIRKRLAIMYFDFIRSNAGNFCTSLYNFMNIPSLQSRRLKIGYLSPYYIKGKSNSASYLMHWIPGMHDRKLVEVFCYSMGPIDKDDPFWKKATSDAEHHVDLTELVDLPDIADRIHADQIDILIVPDDLIDNRIILSVLGPAPILIVWLGQKGTSGACRCHSYFVTDYTVTPSEKEDDYVEKCAHLPNSCFIGDQMRMFPDVVGRNNVWNMEEVSVPQIPMEQKRSMIERWKWFFRQIWIWFFWFFTLNSDDKEEDKDEDIQGNDADFFKGRKMENLPKNAIVYCNFSPICKIDADTMKMWMKILKQVPNSVLWLLPDNDLSEDSLDEYIETYGYSALKPRIIYCEWVNREEHIRRIRLADIYLDTPQWNGRATSLDVLWTGTPIVTVCGDLFINRITASLLKALDVEELIALTSDDYVVLAVNLGQDPKFLAKIRSQIWARRMTSSLFIVEQYCRNFEAALLKMFGALPVRESELIYVNTPIPDSEMPSVEYMINLFSQMIPLMQNPST